MRSVLPRPSPCTRPHRAAPPPRAASGPGTRQSWDVRRFVSTVLFFNPLSGAAQALLGPPLKALGVMAQPASAVVPPAVPAPGLPVLFDAAAALGGAGPPWGALDDGVMGGVSVSGLELEPAGGEAGGPAAVFRGVLSTANNGGFASVRTRNFAPPADASGAAGVELRLKGDGQRYKLFIRTAEGWDALAYGAGFDTKAGEWQTVRLPWAAFRAIFRARSVPGAPPLEKGRICSLQLMLSKFEVDGALNPAFRGDGTFALPVSRIATFA